MMHSPIQQAEDCLARGDRAGATEQLAEASRIDPFDPEPPLLAAMIHFEDGQMGRAASCAVQSIRVRPFNPAALNLLAVACGDAGYRTEALRILNRLEKEVPGFKPAKRNLKHLRRAKDRVEKQPGFPAEDVRALLDRPAAGLSVCIALDDTDPGVEETLESIRGIANQIVLLDATSDPKRRPHSEDETVEIVRTVPCANRSVLLNAAVSRADQAWVLVMKPGETLDRASRGKLTQALDRHRTLVHFVRVTFSDDTAVLAARLFRNAPGLVYAGSVFPSIRPALHVLQTDWRLDSFRPGVTLRGAAAATNLELTKEDRQRFLAASCEELKSDPTNPALVRQFAQVSTEMGDAEQALDALTHLEGSAWLSAEEFAVSSARCLIRLHRWNDARERIESHHAKHRPTRNTSYLLGVAAGGAGDPAAATRALKKSSTLPEEDSTLPPLPEIRTAALPNLLGAAWMDLGKYDEAAEAFGTALRREPHSVEARMGLLSLHMVRGEIETLLQQLDAWIDGQGENPRVWHYGSVLLSRIPDLAEVNAQWVTEARRRFPRDPDLRRQEVEAHLRGGRIDVALESLRGSESVADLAARFVASLAAGVELPDVPADVRMQIETGVLVWLKAWMSHQEFEPLDRALTRIASAQPALPGLPDRTAAWLEEIGQADAAARIRQQRPGVATAGS